MTLEIYLIVISTIFLLLGIGGTWCFIPEKIVEQKPEIDQQKLERFSDREQQMILFLSLGYTNKEIANTLEISPNTVKTHLSNLFEKLGVSNRTQAVSEAKLLKIIN